MSGYEAWVCPDDFELPEEPTADDDDWLPTCPECLREVSPRRSVGEFCSEKCRDASAASEARARQIAGRPAAPRETWNQLGATDADRLKAVRARELYVEKRDRGNATDVRTELARTFDERPSRERYLDGEMLRGGTPKQRRVAGKTTASQRLREILEREATRNGFDFAAFVAPFGRGKPGPQERVRRAALRGILEAEKGVKPAVIAETIGWPRDSVSRLLRDAA